MKALVEVLFKQLYDRAFRDGAWYGFLEGKENEKLTKEDFENAKKAAVDEVLFWYNLGRAIPKGENNERTEKES